MSDPTAVLKEHQPKHKFLIAIDSDGCAFDTMEIKHKECFIPNIIRYWGLQAVSKYARAAGEFVNLYSMWRGVNRFPALIKVFDLLKDWPEAMAREIEIPEAPNLRNWIKIENKLGNPALEAWCNAHDEQQAPDMHLALQWSKAVNQSVSDIVQGGLPPFPYVRECLHKAQDQADMMVCSQTPCEALQREWEEQDLARYVFAINGQEMGKKGEHIGYACEDRYEEQNILMIGDANGDLKAARANNALFYPINPGCEEASWEQLYRESLDKFFAGEYAGAYEAQLIAEFEDYLPETPPWKRGQ
ncbi:MAG: HAD family hydrolase [Candidatus Hydrogenedentota bacterium]